MSAERDLPQSAPSLARRVFVVLACVATTVALVVFVGATLVFQSSLVADAHEQLSRECSMAASVLDGCDGTGAQVTSLATVDTGDTRVTLVAVDGTVLYDSLADAASLLNHLDRPEVAEALADGTGSSERESDTAGNVSIYQASRLASGAVLRLSVDRAGVSALLVRDLWMLAVVVAATVVASWVVARLVAGRLVRPVLAIDPARPQDADTYEELSPLVARLAQQQTTLTSQMRELEGAERMRREFTSNVTHELKTPLAAISGAAELIRDGIAKPEDVAGFAGRIVDETAHLTALVNDILTLSKLDESERSSDRALVGSTEPIDLGRVALDVASRLARPAEKAEVSIDVSGDATRICGVARLIDELVYNLCDNAIRYNRPGGTVWVWTGADACGHPILRVTDTGRGIPTEAQGKVFERFYRVDASRSRASGGTGLGLAIVKHVAAFHGAEVGLESMEGEGTTVTVTFPVQEGTRPVG
ncbi:MAG: ATP-binding protein [Atopobiaceae bacterium]|nr:ATP-binding protein [Atopobiaceae bacterium]MDD3177593.1 ATP-binding protein [Atopobiaceae bacterium]MDD4379917.1 ATP-binding protein [Atopobiaceae bacterium]